MCLINSKRVNAPNVNIFGHKQFFTRKFLLSILSPVLYHRVELMQCITDVLMHWNSLQCQWDHEKRYLRYEHQSFVRRPLRFCNRLGIHSWRQIEAIHTILLIQFSVKWVYILYWTIGDNLFVCGVVKWVEHTQVSIIKKQTQQ